MNPFSGPPSVYLFVKIEPVAQPRHRVVPLDGDRVGRYINKNHPIHVYKQTINLVARQATVKILTGPVAVDCRFYLRASSTSPEWAIIRPDLDNLIKGVYDSIKGVVWRDDSQVVCERTAKLFAPPTHLEGCMSARIYDLSASSPESLRKYLEAET
jgi:Holliday junction resolvase RusA-like endonuclease